MIDFTDHFLFFSFFLYFEICKYDKDKKYFLFPFLLEKWKIRLAEVCTDPRLANSHKQPHSLVFPPYPSWVVFGCILISFMSDSLSVFTNYIYLCLFHLSVTTVVLSPCFVLILYLYLSDYLFTCCNKGCHRLIVLILSVSWLVFGQQSICICLFKISLRMVRSERRHLYFIRRQRYIETVMRHTSNAGMQSCTKSCYEIEYSIRVQ